MISARLGTQIGFGAIARASVPDRDAGGNGSSGNAEFIYRPTRFARSPGGGSFPRGVALRAQSENELFENGHEETQYVPPTKQPARGKFRFEKRGLVDSSTADTRPSSMADRLRALDWAWEEIGLVGLT